MYNLHLTPEQLEIRDTVRDFVANEIKPIALKPERLEASYRPLLFEILDKASQMGLRTLALSEENGGIGADALTSCIVSEELAVGEIDVAAVLAETSRLAHSLFDRLMTPAQRTRFLPQFLADDRYHLAFADHEPGTDNQLGANYHRPSTSDSHITTEAVQDENGNWIISGAKDSVRNAPVAKLFLVPVKLLDQPNSQKTGALLVAHNSPGLTVRERPHPRRSLHGAFGDLIFTSCPVPPNNFIKIDDEAVFQIDRPQDPALALGVGRAAYEAALDYARLRIQGGRPIIEHQAIAIKLAEIAINLEVTRSAIRQAAYASDHPNAISDRSLPNLPLSTITKVFSSEVVYRATKDAAEIFGAMGVMRDMPLQKYIHDALVSLHSDRGNSDAKLQIAEALAGYQRPQL